MLWPLSHFVRLYDLMGWQYAFERRQFPFDTQTNRPQNPVHYQLRRSVPYSGHLCHINIADYLLKHVYIADRMQILLHCNCIRFVRAIVAQANTSKPIVSPYVPSLKDELCVGSVWRSNSEHARCANALRVGLICIYWLRKFKLMWKMFSHILRKIDFIG